MLVPDSIAEQIEGDDLHVIDTYEAPRRNGQPWRLSP